MTGGRFFKTSRERQELVRARLREALGEEGSGGPAVPAIPRRQGDGPSRLSFSQQRLWFLDRLEPGSPAYNIPGGLRLRGRLEVPALTASLGEIVRRHEVLRTVFVAEDGRPLQVALPPAPFPLPAVDLSALPEAAREGETRRLAREEAHRPFDLGRGPLLRAALLRLASDDHVLVFNMHHIVSDGWSMGVLVRELGALYGAFIRREPLSLTALPPLPIQYADFAEWQRRWLEGGVLEEQLAYWRERLAGVPVLEMPLDHPRPALQSPRVATLDFSLPPAPGLEDLARRHGATPFMALLALFQALLRRHTGQDDIAVGTPVANRRRAEVEGLIGFFVNTLVLRVDLPGDPTFPELLDRVREVSFGAFAHQDVPFEKLVEELRPERDPSRPPLFQAMLTLQNAPAEPPAIDGLVLGALPAEAGAAKFDLTLALWQSGDGYAGSLEHTPDLFEAATMARLAGHLAGLAAGITTGARLSALPLLSAAERQQLAVEWNDTASRREEQPLVPERIAGQAAVRPDAVAVVWEGEFLTYGGLRAWSGRLARRLRELGVSRDVRVALCLERSPAMAVAMAGVFASGGAWVPLDPAYPEDRLTFMLEDSGAAFLVTERALMPRLPSRARVLCLEDLLEPEAEGPPPAVEPDGLAYVIYTSGSTGRPKGVMVEHRGLARVLDSFLHRFGYGAGDVQVSVSSFSFDAVLLELVTSLMAGGTCVLAPLSPLEPRRLAALLAGATRVLAVPSLMRRLLEELEPAAVASGLYSSLRTVFLGGEAAPLDLLRQVGRAFPCADAAVLYGPTEGTILCTSSVVPAGESPHRSLLGRPLPDMDLHLFDRHGSRVPVGVAGEIWIGGAGVTRGYLGRPELTAERYPEVEGRRFYRTGDLARWTVDGRLEFLGRVDQQVKLRGFRIEPGEIEAALLAHPAVREAAVMVREDSPGDRRLVAYLVAAGPAPTTEALRVFLGMLLPEAMVPSAFVALDAMPLTPNAKLDRRALPAPERGREGGTVAPRDPFEEVLLGIWAEVLGVPPGKIGIHDDFFALGGHSLLAAQVAARARNAFGFDLAVRSLFTAPTVAALAREVERGVAEGRGGEELPLLPVPRDGEVPLSFVQQRLWLLDQIDPGSPLYNLPFALRLTGRLSVAALAWSLEETVRRHESLRTVFPVRDGHPVQVPLDGWRPDLPVADLGDLPDAAAQVSRLAAAEAGRGFDLARGPLLRATLLRTGADEHVLLLILHHIVADGWSIGVLVREVAALYESALRGERAPLPALPVQYADFAGWQRRRLTGEVLERQLAWWRQRLAGVQAIDLPLDRPRSTAQRGNPGASRPLHLPAGLAAGLSALARRHGATQFMTLVAAFETLLGRISGQQDFAVGTPVSGRGRQELEGVIGFFVDTLALRSDLAGDPSFSGLLARVRETTLESFARQEVPFDRIVEELQPERALDRQPLFQVFFALHNLPEQPITLPGLTLAPVEAATGTSKFELSLASIPTEDGLESACEYRTDLFDAATIDRLLEHLRTLLAGIVEDPERRLSDLPLLPEAEIQLLADWGGERGAFTVAACLHELFAARAAADPRAPAVTLGVDELTYGELDRRANRLAHHLRRLGAGPEVVVAVCLERSLELVTALLAVLKAGAAYLPIDPDYPPERQALMLDDSGAPLLLTTEPLAGALPPHGARPVLLDTPAAWAGESGDAPDADAVPANLAYVIYTSGSTGRPKGVAVTHANAVRLFAATRERFGFGPGDVWTLFHSYAFDFSVWEIWGALLHGGRLVVVPHRVSRSPEDFLRLLAAEGVTVLNQTPSAFRQLVWAEESLQPSQLALRLVIFGGEALDVAALAPWIERHGDRRPELVNMYGITETTVHVTLRRIEGRDVEGAPRTGSPIGQPLSDLAVHLLDATGRRVPLAVPGEIHVGGAGLARGYLGRPGLTAERFVPDPFAGPPGARLYRSGDLARWRPDGELEYLGRIDHQVKVRGFRIELGEIEAALAACPGVRQAVVLAREEDGGDRRLVAWVVPRELGALDPGALRERLRETLPDYMVPAAVLVLDALPLTPHGKVDRKALPEPGEAREEAVLEPRTPMEKAVAAVWAEVLGRDRVGAGDDFFALGGHSLLATRAVARLREVRELLGTGLQVLDLFEEPTVAGLARRLEARLQAAAPEAPSIGPAPRHLHPQGLPLSFAQQRLWFLDRLDPGSPAYNIPSMVRLRGALDSGALEEAWSALVRRHETLRTVFAAVDGRPAQKILPPIRERLPRVDLTALAAAAREAEAHRLVEVAALTTFDLARGPLQKVLLLRLAAEEHLFVLVQHHIVSDGWSAGVLLREVAELYRGSSLPPLPIQYADFAWWQREWLQGEVLDERLAYWRRELSGGDLPALALPTDRPRAAVQTFTGARESLSLPAELSRAVHALGQAEGTTLFMVLLAAFQAVLGRWAGQEDVVVGSPIAGRDRAETQGLIGFFVNTLVLRGDLSGGPSFRELLRRTRRTVLGAFVHQDLPFETLVEALRPERDLTRTPLFQVFFNLLNFAAERIELPGLTLEAGAAEAAPSKFDLTLYAAEDDGLIHLSLIYDAGLFTAARMRELLAQLHRFLTGATADPDVPIHRLSLITPEARRILPDPTLALTTIQAGRVRRALPAPDRPALQDREGAWTYGDLNGLANRLAHRLRAGGVAPGDRVAIWAHRGASLAWAILGTLEAGAAFVLLDPAYPPSRLADRLRLAAPRAWLALAGPPPAEMEEALAGITPDLRIALPSSLAEARSAMADWPAGSPGVEVGPEDLAYVAFTSGSTGAPKGILGDHGPLSHFLDWQAATFGLGEEDRFALLGGLSHDPLLRDLFAPLTLGATLCVPEPKILLDGWRLAAWLAESRVTVLHLTPALGRLLAAADANALPALRWAFFGGDVLTREDVEGLRRIAPAVTCVNFYGATETPQAMGWYPVPADGAEMDRLPLGWGIDGVQLLVVNAAGEPAGVGELGEIWIRTPYLARGYLGDPELTRQRFVANPWRAGDPADRLYRTGDLGRHLPDGAVAFAGRADDQVKIRGFRVEPGEVEAALSRHAAVRECAVLARQGSDGELRLVAYVVSSGAPGLEAELRDHLRSRLPAYSVPSAFVLLDALPRNVHGKLDRRALPEPRPPEAALPEAGAPRTPAEEVLAGIWREVLGVEQVGPGDDFFALGGHSLRAVQVTARAGDAFGVELPVRALFEAPTLARLAHRVEDLLRQGSGLSLPPLVPLPRDGRELPLSFAQTRLWFLDRLEGAGPAYNMPAAVRLTGPLDLPALARALGEAVRRHEVLRTSYPTVDGRPALRIAPPAPVPLPLVNLAALPTALRETEAGRLAREEAARPFDLGRGPLVRAGLLRLGAAEHVLLLTLHHIVSDGWSMGVLVAEVSALYRAFAAGLPSPLPELPVQYADYAAWQRSWLRGEALAGLLTFWRERLAGLPPVLELPTDRPRPAVRGWRGGRSPLDLPGEASHQVRSLAGRSGATLFMVLLAAFETWLLRLTGQDRLAVGTPVAGRDRAELEGLVGFFANTLALPGELDGDPAFAGLLGRVRETALAAYAHQQMPFEKLVDELELPRSLSHTPLFQVMLTLQNTPATPATLVPAGSAGSLSLPGVGGFAMETGAAKFDWTLYATEAEGRLSFVLEYAAELFEPVTAGRFLDGFAALLAGAAAEPGRRLSELPLLSAAERHQLRVEWNDTRKSRPEGACIPRRFEARADAVPELRAVTFERHSLTYRQLDRAANRLARHLRRLGVGPDVPVAVALDRSLELVVALLGILKAGGAYVPLDPGYPDERLALLLADTAAPVVLTLGEHRRRFAAGAAVVCLDEDAAAIQRESPERLAAGEVGIDGESLAYVIYTSGSTGTPKGAMNTHAAIANRLLWMQEAYGLDATDRVLQKTPYTFDVSVWEFFWPLLAGARLVVARPGAHRDPEALLRIVAEQGVTTLHFVPSMLQAFLEEMERQGAGPERVPGLRRVIASGEALPAELARRCMALTGAALHNLYGPTEAAVDVTAWPCAPDLAGPTVAIGRPIANLEVHLLDRRFVPVPAGVAGELHIGGAGLARGYLARPERTAEAFVPHPASSRPGARLYRTGDLARHRPDGSLEFLGRLDHQVKIRGVRIEPGEVEAALARHPAVREAVVAALADGPGRNRLVAWLTVRDAAPTVSELRRFLLRSLPEPMVPSVFVTLPELPLTTSGKVDRRALPRPEGERPELARAYVAPRTPAEERLAVIWAEVLGLDRAGVHDNFFELGGDSILSIQIVSRARQAGLVLAPRQVFQHQTIAELAAVAGTVPATEAEQGPVTGPAPLTPIQRWFFAAEPPASHHWNQALLLEAAEPLSAAALAAAVLRLADHHDALRLRFCRRFDRNELGEVRQEIAPPHPAAVPFAVVDLSALPGLEEAAARVQASLDLAAGPIARFVAFDLGAGITRLLVVIHHLAVDGVSWRVLLEDLEALYGGLPLPAKTTSFKAWAERLAEWAGAEEIQGPAPPLPVDFEGGEDTEGRARLAAVELDAEETRALLQEVPAAYNSQVNDALLAALARAVVPWTGGTAVSVDLEGHGREEIFPDVDLSRTVGWFTTISPVRLELAPGDGPGEMLVAVKETLRAVPNRGLDWSGQSSSILFNYLGRFDSVLSGSSPFRIAEEDPGPTRSPRAPRRYRLEVSGAVAGGRLRVTWRYGAEVYRPETIARLAAAFAAELRSLVAHCRSLERCAYTPSDFPGAGLDAGALRRALAELAPALPPGRERWIESLDPLAPAQEGMLFETLHDGTGERGGSGLHVEQLALAWRGDLDTAAFERAWRRLLERHSMLRTAFLWRDQARPLQAVLRQVVLPLLRDDWRALSPAEQEERLTRFLIDERRRGFDPSRPPLLRLALIRTGDDVHQLVWTHHHLLMDGWCRAMLLDELVTCYRAFAGGQEPVLPPARPYRDYVTWLGLQDTTAADAFWAGQLQDLTRPTPLGRCAFSGRGEGSGAGRPAQATGSVGGGEGGAHTKEPSKVARPHSPEADRWTEREVHLSPAETSALQALARGRRLTLSTVVQGAWAALLGRYAGTDSVVFGITVSGRPADLPGIESTVGLFIHTVPLRARLQPAAPFWPWLRDLQELSTELRRYETTPADRIRERSGVPAALPLYESLLVFESYPGRPAADEAAGPALQAEVTGARTFGARTGVPLTLLVFPGESLALRVIADAGRLDPEDADRGAIHLASILRAVATGAEPSLEALQEGIPEAELPRVQPLPATPDASPYVAPRSPLEEAVAALWAEVLGIPRAGIHDGFFTLGGHSLLAARLVAALRHAFQVDLPLRALFESPTVAGLAAEIAARKGAGELPAAWPEIVPDPATRHLPFPLTDVQQAYWIGRGGAFELGNVATHLYFEVESRILDPGRFQSAWRRLVERHDMLRAVVLPDGTQRILPEVPPYEIALLDLRHLSPEEAGRGLLALRERMSHQVLPADRWPLFDIRASLLPAGRVRLHVSLDLLIGDAWSWRLLAAELAGLYADPEAELPPLSLSFRDYVLAVEGLRGTPPYRRALDYWRERLADLPPAPELPLAKSPGAVDAPRFVRRSTHLEPAEWSRLKARAARSGLTPSGVLLAAFAEVLGTWSRSPRFTLNLTLFNRLPLHPEVDRIVGDFTSLTLLAVDPPAGGFEARARHLQERLWADLDHRLVSGVEVMRELGRSQEGARGAAIMPVVFTSTLALGTPDPEEEPEDAEAEAPLEVVYTVGQTPQVWLDHQVREQGGSLVVNWDAVEELFPAGMLDAMVEAHRRLLGGLADGDWSWREAGRSLLPAAQLALVAAVNDTALEVAPPDAVLHGGFLEQARRQPHRPAVIAPDRTLTYGELRRRSGRLAHRLRDLGAGPGRLVAVSMEKGWEQVVATLAILEAGAAYLPVDPGLPLERRRYLYEQGGVEVALTQPWLDRDLEWPADIRRIAVDREDLAIGAMEEPSPLPAPSPEDLAYVIYTSGSTGQPKGVMIDHRGAVNTIADINRRIGVGPDDRVLALSSLSFDLSVYDLFGLLAAGGAVVLPGPEAARDPARWAELMEIHRVTLWNTVPALLEMLVEHRESSLPLSRSLRLVLLSGDWIPVSLPDRVRGLAREDVQVVSLGGATEASIWSISYPIDQVDPLWRSIPYGRPLANQTFHVLDGELAPRPVWVSGELYIGGDGVALGYWRDEERTRASFLRHPRTGERLYRTGDLGRLLPGGDIELLGREDFQVKIQGFRIELGEIEAALLRHPGLAAAAVVAEGPARGARRLVAFVVPAEGAVSDPGELRRFLADRLPDYMVPAALVPLGRLPLTPNGKVDRSALARLAALPEGVAPSGRTAPSNPVEEVVAGVWAELLGIGRLGVHDDVFALGGQSLVATQAAARLARSFGMEVPLRHLFEAPTVAELAERVEMLRRAATGTAPPPLLPTRRADGEGLPLSFAQERLWFLEQLEPGTAVHHIASAVRLTGSLDPAALAAALAGVTARHEALRTTFHSVAEEGGTPVQRVTAPAAEQPLPLIDLRPLPDARREAEALRLVRAEPLRLFDLTGRSGGPLWRTTLVRTGEEEHILLVTLHHIVADGWSIAVLIGDVAALYRAAVTGEPAPQSSLPPLPVQYADYARWQRQWLRGEALDAHLAWWKGRLGGSLPVLELPADHPRPAVRGHRGGQVRSLLPPDLSRDLERLARREGATLYMTLLAGFQTLLARWTGQTDLLTGFPIAGRNRAETEGLVGLFVNTLVIRTGLAGDPAFAAVLARVREEALGAYDHQDLPFEKLVEEMNPERSLSHTAVFQVLFSLQSTPAAAPAGVPGLALGFLPQEPAAAKFDLTLNLTETAEGIAGSWIYNADLFEAATVLRMTGHFERLLAGAVADPGTRISRLPLLSEAEAQQILVEVNDSLSPFDGTLPVHRLFARQAERAPDAVAAVFEEEMLTYGELRRRVRQLARHLRARGVGPDVPVGILVSPSLHLVVGLLGILEAGGGYVGLDPAQPAERLAFQLADSRARVLVTEGQILASLGVAAKGPSPLGGGGLEQGGGQEGGGTNEGNLDGGRPHLDPPPVPTLPRPEGGRRHPTSLLQTSPSPGEGERGGGRGGRGVRALEVVRLDADWPVIAAAPEIGDDGLPDEAALDALAYVIYTSGSTGRPKGVANRHRQLLVYLNAMVERLQPPADSRWTMHQTLAVDAPITQLYVTLCRGGVLHVLPLERATDGSALAEYLARHPIDYLKIAPSHLAALQAGMEPRDLLPLRLVMLGGEGLSREWAEALQAVAPPGCVILNHYGPTETTCGVLTCRVTEGPFPWSGATVPLGRPLPNDRTYVLDAHLEPVPFGVPGELHIGGPGVSSGYLGRPELTAERFIPDPFSDGRDGPGGRLYRTGDLARLLPDGRAEFLGRIDHQIKVRGYRVELEEIEAILGEHPGVRTAMVLAEGSDEGDARLVACVVPEAASEAAPGELRRFLRRRLPEYMVPGVYLPLDSMPRTPQGKVDRKALSRLAFDAIAVGAGQVEAAAPRVPPRSAAEQVVAGLWAEVLGRDPAEVGVRDLFFDVGGHSLLATRLAARLRQAFRVELPLRAVFERPTIEGLVEALGRLWGDAGVVEEIAEAYLELASLSEDEVREMLAGERE